MYDLNYKKKESFLMRSVWLGLILWGNLYGLFRKICDQNTSSRIMDIK